MHLNKNSAFLFWWGKRSLLGSDQKFLRKIGRLRSFVRRLRSSKRRFRAEENKLFSKEKTIFLALGSFMHLNSICF